jgi:hypothetical protein
MSDSGASGRSGIRGANAPAKLSGTTDKATPSATIRNGLQPSTPIAPMMAGPMANPAASTVA